MLAAASLGLILLWGCWLIYGAGVGVAICQQYPGRELNPLLSQWCSGNSWRGWLGACVAIAGALFATGVAMAMARTQGAWLIPGTMLAVIAIWAGFTLPQEVAGANILPAQPAPAAPQPYQQTPTTSTAAVPPRLERPVPPILPAAHAQGLGHDIVPSPLFRCQRGFGRLETVTGPNAITNFDTATLRRSPKGLCATFTSTQISSFATYQDETEVVALTFTPRHPAPANRGPLSIEVWTANQGSTYSLIVRPSDSEARITTVGNLGIARNHLSILIQQPRLPSWILDGSSSWTARLT